MRVVHVTESDFAGGAARAAYRIHQALVCHEDELDVVSEMVVRRKITSDPRVQIISIPNCPTYKPSQMLGRIKKRLVNRYYSSFRTDNPILHSLASDETGLSTLLNQSDFGLIHFHWLGNSTLSIEEIGRLNRSVVWTLHDQWAFCGAEHYVCPPPAVDERYTVGYTASSRRKSESGPDLNRNVWLRKRASWNRPMHIICPSQWLADCARRSKLMKDWPVTVVPYCLDLSVFRPGNQVESRNFSGLPQDKLLIVFGAMGGTSDPRKGGDLLFDALRLLAGMGASVSPETVELVIFGQSNRLSDNIHGYRVHNVGVIDCDETLRHLYVSADLMVIPSRQDNLPNTGIEAHACGTPVAAFEVGGLPEIVDHKITGALASPFEAGSLANAIAWILSDPERRKGLGRAARIKAVRSWSDEVVSKMYANVYKSMTTG